MKNKIKAALQQGQYKNLGLDEKAFEGVAAYLATSITDEAEIETKVNSDEVKALLKSFQSVADAARAKAKNEPNPKPSEPGNQPPNDPEPTNEPAKQTEPQPQDMAKIIADAVAAAVKPLSDKIAGFEASRARETAVAALDKFVSEWDYAKGFPSESELAKRIALKVYKAGGETMNGEQLIAAFREEFDPAVKAKGVTDFTKPFESGGGGGDNHQARFEAMAKRQQERQGAVAGE